MKLTINKEKPIKKLKAHLERHFPMDKVEFFENKPILFRIRSGASQVKIRKDGDTFTVKSGLNFKNIWIILGIAAGLFVLVIGVFAFLAFAWLNYYEARTLLKIQALNALKTFYGIKG